MPSSAKKRNSKKLGRRSGEEDEGDMIFEDLDMNVPFADEGDNSNTKRQRGKQHDDDEDDDANSDFDEQEEEDANEYIVHNKRDRGAGSADHELDIHPSDAHKLEGRDIDDGEGGIEAQEEALAIRTSRKLRKSLAESDFDLGFGTANNKGEAASPVSSKAVAAEAQKRGSILSKEQVEVVEVEFGALSRDDKLRALQAQSPEVLKLMQEFEKQVRELKGLVRPLAGLLAATNEAIKKRKRQKKNATAEQARDDAKRDELIAFLQTKVHLMLSYCIHIAFYLLLKVEGHQVNGHPVLDRLVEIRTYLEKVWALEGKLRYALSKLLSAKGGGRVAGGDDEDGDDLVEGGARLDRLRPIQTNDGDGLYKPTKLANVSSDESRRRKETREMTEALEVAREEEEMLTRLRRKKGNVTVAHSTEALEHLKAANPAFEPEEDQYFDNLVGGFDDDDDDDKEDGEDEDEEEGNDEEDGDEEAPGGKQKKQLSSIARLRKKLAAPAGTTLARKILQPTTKGKKNKAPTFEDLLPEAAKKKLAAQEKEGGDFEDEDGAGSDEDGDEMGYEAMVAETKQQLAAKKKQGEDEEEAKQVKFADEEGDDKRKKRRHIDQRIEKHRGLTKARPKDRKNPRVNKRHRFAAGERAANAQSKKYVAGGDDFVGTGAIKTHITRSTKF